MRRLPRTRHAQPLALGLALGLVALLPAGCHGPHLRLQGAGATFPAPLYARWIALYERAHPSVAVDYRAVGSSRGIERIAARSVHFGASDALPTEAQLRDLEGELVVLPMVAGSIVLAYNLPGLDGELLLDGPTVAAIYLGEISRWDDPAIGALNPELALPPIPIRVAHRKDGSGTTAIFTDYLSAVSPASAARVGQGQRVRWPREDAEEGEGNDGVAQRVLLSAGGLGYVEQTYARNAGLDAARLRNRAGRDVQADVAAVQAAARQAPEDPGLLVPASLVDAEDPAAYPIAGYTYVLVYEGLENIEDAAEARGLLDYLRWTLTEGQAYAADMGYVPLAPETRDAVLAEVEALERALAERDEEGAGTGTRATEGR